LEWESNQNVSCSAKTIMLQDQIAKAREELEALKAKYEPQH
jgi:hypothetical protein